MPTITVDIKAAGGAQIQREFERAAQSVGRQFPQAARAAEVQIASVTKAIDANAASFARLRSSAAGVFAGAIGVGAIAGITRAVIDSTNAIVGWQNSFKAVTPSATAAVQAMAFVRSEADRLGLSLESSATQFAKLTAATRGTSLEGEQTRKIFTAVSEAARVLNLSTESTEGAFRALEQMVSKGKVQAEELRSQLGERLPGSFRLAAEAMKVTTSELDRMLKAGEVTAEDLLPKLADRLRDVYAAGAVNAANSPAAEMNRLKNAVFDLNVAVGESGVMEALTSGARALTDGLRGVVESGAIDKIASGVTSIGVAATVAFGGRALQAIGAYAAAQAMVAKGTATDVALTQAFNKEHLESVRIRAAELTSTLSTIGAIRTELGAKLALARVDADAAQRAMAASKAAATSSFALRVQREAAESLVAVQGRLNLVSAEYAALGKAQQAVQTQLAATATSLIAAQTAVAGSLTLTQAAMARLASIGKSLFAMVGGWPTIILAAAYAAYQLWDSFETGGAAMESALSAADNVIQQNERSLARLEAAMRGVDEAMVETITTFTALAAESQNAQRTLLALTDGGEGFADTWTAMAAKLGPLGGVLGVWAFEAGQAENAIENATAAQDRMIETSLRLALAQAQMAQAQGENSDAVKVAVDAYVRSGATFEHVYEILQRVGGEVAYLNSLWRESPQAVSGAAAGFDAETEKFLSAAQGRIDALTMTREELVRMSAAEAAMAATTDSARIAINAAADAEIAALQASEQRRASIRGSADAMKAAERAAKEEENALKALDKEWADYAAILGDVQADHKDVASAYAQQTRQFDAQAQGIQNEINLLGVSGEARERMAIALEAERLARDANGNMIEEERKRLEELLSTLNDAAKLDAIVMEFDLAGFDDLLRKIDELNAGLEKVGGQKLVDLRESLGNARQEALLFATEALGRGISSLQSMAEEGTSAYKKLEIAQAALNLATAIGAIANQGLGDPYTAFARIAAMIAAMNQLGLAVSGGGGASSQSAEVRQETQGTGTVLGDAEAKSQSILNAMEITADATSELVGINRGMLRALQSLESGIGSASGMIARGGAAVDVGPLSSGGGILSGLPDPLGLSNMIFGGSQELIDQGIVIMGGALNDMLNSITVGAYNTIETEGGWFSSDDVDTTVTDITAEFGEQFALIIGSIADTVREGALALGILPAEVEAAIAAYQVEETRISLMGLTAEEQRAELQAVFSGMFDGLAEDVVPWAEQFQQLGEGLGETLVRVATSVQVTQEAMGQLGFALDQTDPELFAQIAVGLIEMTGGIDEFITSMQSFMSNFAPEAHKFEVAQDAITRAFAQFNLEVPATRDGMWALMQSLDATTEQGREQIAMLLQLAGVSDAYYSMLEDQAESAAQQARDLAEAEQDLADARAEAIQAYAATVQGVNRQLYELSGATDFRQSLAAIQEQYMSTVATLNNQARAAGLAGARTEDLTAAMLLHARQSAAALRELEDSIRSAAESAGYTPLGEINAEIAALQDREEQAARATANLSNSIRDMGRIASDVASAMLGDMSPLSGAAKADYALRALQDGAIGLDAALNAGRDVFASGQDFNQFFQRAIAIAGNRKEDTPQSVGQTVSLAMRELLKQQAELQAQADQAGQLLQAQDVAAMLADASFARGEDWQVVAESLGLSVAPLLSDLGMTEDQLTAWIAEQQAAQNELQTWLATNVTADAMYIVDELRAMFERVDDPLLVPPEPVPEAPYEKDPWTGGAKSSAEMQEEQSGEIRRLREVVELMSAQLVGLQRESLTAEQSQATSLQTIAQQEAVRRVDDIGRTPRSSRMVVTP